MPTENFGLVSLVPTIVVITTAVLSHRPIAALLAGVVVGLAILEPGNIVGNLADINLALVAAGIASLIFLGFGLSA